MNPQSVTTLPRPFYSYSPALTLRLMLRLMLRLGVFPLLSAYSLMPYGTQVHESICEGNMLPPKALAHPWA
jgi:hypothetical protein